MTHPVASKLAAKFVPSQELREGDRILARKFFNVVTFEIEDGPVQGKVTHVGKQGCVVQPLNPLTKPVVVDFGAIIHRFKS